MEGEDMGKRVANCPACNVALDVTAYNDTERIQCGQCRKWFYVPADGPPRLDVQKKTPVWLIVLIILGLLFASIYFGIAKETLEKYNKRLEMKKSKKSEKVSLLMEFNAPDCSRWEVTL